MTELDYIVPIGSRNKSFIDKYETAIKQPT